jgi:hypothetical protein
LVVKGVAETSAWELPSVPIRNKSAVRAAAISSDQA